MSEIGLQGACGGPISMHDHCFCTELNITGTVELKAILAFHVSALLDNATTSSLNAVSYTHLTLPTIYSV